MAYVRINRKVLEEMQETRHGGDVFLLVQSSGDHKVMSEIPRAEFEGLRNRIAELEKWKADQSRPSTLRVTLTGDDG